MKNSKPSTLAPGQLERLAACADAVERLEKTLALARERITTLGREFERLESIYVAADDAGREKILPELRGLQARRELQPGIVGKIDGELAATISELNALVDRGLHALRPAARERLADMQRRWERDLLKECGGDAKRVRPVLQQLTASSEMERWRQYGRSGLTGSPVQRARKLPVFLQWFEDGKSLSEASAEAARFGSSTP